MGERIGIMGGTFDPIHIGHLLLAEAAREQYALDKVLFIPSGIPPFKKNRIGLAGNEERAAMCALAIIGNPCFELSRVEIEDEEISYTSRTLTTLTATMPDARFFFIVGADALFELPYWHEPEEIFRRAVILYATREEASLESLEAQCVLLQDKYNAVTGRIDFPSFPVSSTMLRERIGEGKSVRYYLPEKVIQYIEEHGLYHGEK